MKIVFDSNEYLLAFIAKEPVQNYLLKKLSPAYINRTILKEVMDNLKMLPKRTKDAVRFEMISNN